MMKAHILLVCDISMATMTCLFVFLNEISFGRDSFDLPSLQEMELFMNDADKNNRKFFPKSVPSFFVLAAPFFCAAHAFASRFLHVIVPVGESRCSLLILRRC